MLLKTGKKSIELVLNIAKAAASLNYFVKSHYNCGSDHMQVSPMDGDRARILEVLTCTTHPHQATVDRSALLHRLPLVEFDKTHCFLDIYITLSKGYCLLVVTNYHDLL